MKDKIKKILSFILCIVVLFATTIPHRVYADDTRHNVESFVVGGGYIYIGGWAVSKNKDCVIQYPSSIYRNIGMHTREDLKDIPYAYGFSAVVGIKSGTYSGEGNQFVLVCWSSEGNGYRVIDREFTVPKPHVVLDKQGGSGGTGSFDVEFGDYPGTISVPTKDGYEFLGYYTKAGGQGSKYINGDGTAAKTWAETGGTSDTAVTTYTLYAYWRAHSTGSAVIENFKAPTCEGEGSYDRVQYCLNTLDHNTTKIYNPTYKYFDDYREIEDYAKEAIPIDYKEPTEVTNNVCHLEMTRTHLNIPTRGHSPSDAVEESHVDPTCTKVGGYDMVVYCSRDGCGKELSRVHNIIPATNHPNTQIVGARSPSLTEEGFSGMTICLDCGEVLDSGHVIEKISADIDLKPEDVRELLDKEIKMSEETKKQLEDMVSENPAIVLEIISSANSTLSILKDKLSSGEINSKEYAESLKIIERIIEICANILTKSIQDIQKAKTIEDKLPEEFDIALSAKIKEFYNRQIKALFIEDGTMDLTVTEDTFEKMNEAIETYVDQMFDAALKLKQCSGKEIVAYVNMVITEISSKTFRDFDKEAADEEFAQNAYHAVLLNMQTQVKTMLTKEYESAISSKKYKGTAEKQLIERYESEIAAIDDLETFEIMVIEVMRQKYVSVMENRLQANIISENEYNELMSVAIDVDTFTPVYKEIFRAWALGLEDEYGISLEELTKATINTAEESIKPDTYKKENKNTNSSESTPEINSIFKLAALTKEKSTDVPINDLSLWLPVINSGNTDSIDWFTKRRFWL